MLSHWKYTCDLGNASGAIWPRRLDASEGSTRWTPTIDRRKTSSQELKAQDSNFTAQNSNNATGQEQPPSNEQKSSRQRAREPEADEVGLGGQQFASALIQRPAGHGQAPPRHSKKHVTDFSRACGAPACSRHAIVVLSKLPASRALSRHLRILGRVKSPQPSLVMSRFVSRIGDCLKELSPQALPCLRLQCHRVLVDFVPHSRDYGEMPISAGEEARTRRRFDA